MNYVYNKNLLINLAEVCTVFVENKKCDNLLQPGVPALIVSQSQMDSGVACWFICHSDCSLMDCLTFWELLLFAFLVRDGCKDRITFIAGKCGATGSS